MSKTLRWILGGLAAILLAAALFLAGFFLGRASLGMAAIWPRMFVPGSGGAPLPGQIAPYWAPDAYGPGMMGGRGGMMAPGVMGGYGGLAALEPLSLDQARQAVEGFLGELGNEDLALGEVMIFDNHAYAEIVEESTGIGAMEVLVDPSTRAVYPEHGPNMMWNLKYSPMGGFGGFGMMGGFRRQWAPEPPDISTEMPVTPEQAIEIARQYLESELPGTAPAEEADRFYGYYTLHVLRDGEPVGMLSVNGFSGAVFPHTWHGDFVEMSEE